MASRSLLILLLALYVMAVSISAGELYTAGGNDGWILGKTIQPVSIKSGDTVLFTYSSGEHNVVQVPQSDYDGCTSYSPYATYSSGSDYLTFYNSGTNYFICSLPGHCEAGMKLTVYVQ